MRQILHLPQKASRWAPFTYKLLIFINLTFFFSTQPVKARVNLDSCSSNTAHEIVKVKHVYDGDTIALHDGRTLRLIGINTPEHGHDGKQNEPFYEAAKTRLQKIIENNRFQLKIILGAEKHDRYQRLLAHIFTPGGINITATLLEEGLGFRIVVPPNLNFRQCYQNAESGAQKLKRGIWNHSFSRPLDAAIITRSTLGFRRITGMVKKIAESQSSFWLNLSENFALRIQKKDLKNFTGYHPSSLINKRIIARGWIYQSKNRQQMSVRHPASIKITKY